MNVRPAVSAAAVTFAVAAAVVVASVVGPAHETVAPAQAAVAAQPLTDVDLVCPYVPAASDESTPMLTAGAPSPGAGTLSVRRLGAATSTQPLAAAPAGASTLRYYPVLKPGPLVVHATGSLARGLTAQVLVRTVNGRARSIASMPCTRPGPETWLVGGAATSGRSDVIFLSNPEQAPAVADITVYTPKGPQSVASAQGLTVPAGKQVSVVLDTLVPGEAHPVVSVRTRSGRVSAAMIDIALNGNQPKGQDWVPPSTIPTLHQVVTGIPADADARRQLTLLVPGQNDATVRIRLATADGTLSPFSVNSLDVQGGQTMTVDLNKLGIQGPYALLVDSTQPVVAGVRTERGGGKTLVDFSYAASTPAMVGTGVVYSLAASDSATYSALQLTAPSDTDVVVRLTPHDHQGNALPSREVTVTAGRTLVVPVGQPNKGYSSVLVESSGNNAAPLVVGWVFTVKGRRGPLFTGGPLLQTPLETVLPPVVPDPSAGLPGH